MVSTPARPVRAVPCSGGSCRRWAEPMITLLVASESVAVQFVSQEDPLTTPLSPADTTSDETDAGHTYRRTATTMIIFMLRVAARPAAGKGLARRGWPVSGSPWRHHELESLVRPGHRRRTTGRALGLLTWLVGVLKDRVMAGPLRVEIEPWGPGPETLDTAAREAVRQTSARAGLDGDHARIVAVRSVESDAEPDPPRRVRATVYDYRAEHALLVDSSLDGDAAPTVRSSTRQPLPSAEEREAALAVLGEDPGVGTQAGRRATCCRTARCPRSPARSEPTGRWNAPITVGLRPTEGGPVTRSSAFTWVAARWCASRAARRATALARDSCCGAPNANQETVTSRAGAARVTIKRDGETLWRLVVVRPAASSGDGRLRCGAARGLLPGHRGSCVAPTCRSSTSATTATPAVRTGTGRTRRADSRPRVPRSRRDSASARSRPPRCWTPAATSGTSPASRSMSTARRWCWSASSRPAGIAT